MCISDVADQLRVGPLEDRQERLSHQLDGGRGEPEEQEKEKDPADWARQGDDSRVNKDS